jgi:hypothetical protein
MVSTLEFFNVWEKAIIYHFFQSGINWLNDFLTYHRYQLVHKCLSCRVAQAMCDNWTTVSSCTSEQGGGSELDEIDKQNTIIQTLQDKLDKVEERVEEQEQYSRRTSLRFNNVRVPTNITEDHCSLSVGEEPDNNWDFTISRLTYWMRSAYVIKTEQPRRCWESCSWFSKLNWNDDCCFIIELIMWTLITEDHCSLSVDEEPDNNWDFTISRLTYWMRSAYVIKIELNTKLIYWYLW